MLESKGKVRQYLEAKDFLIACGVYDVRGDL